MMKYKNLIIGTLILLSSCMTLNDRLEELGDGYKFHVDGKWTKIYGGNTYHNTDIYSDILEHHYNDQYIIAKQKPNLEHHKIFMRSNFSGRFITYSYYLSDSASTAFKNETTPFIRNGIKADSSLYSLLENKGVTDKNSIADWEIIDSVLDSIFKSDPYYIKLLESDINFWIIDKDNNQKYGPLTKSEFDKQNNILNTQLNFKN